MQEEKLTEEISLLKKELSITNLYLHKLATDFLQLRKVFLLYTKNTSCSHCDREIIKYYCCFKCRKIICDQCVSNIDNKEYCNKCCFCEECHIEKSNKFCNISNKFICDKCIIKKQNLNSLPRRGRGRGRFPLENLF